MKLLKIEHAAELLGVSPWTIRSWIAQRRIRSAKLGSRRLIHESEIARLIEDGTRTAESFDQPTSPSEEAEEAVAT